MSDDLRGEFVATLEYVQRLMREIGVGSVSLFTPGGVEGWLYPGAIIDGGPGFRSVGEAFDHWRRRRPDPEFEVALDAEYGPRTRR